MERGIFERSIFFSCFQGHTSSENDVTSVPKFKNCNTFSVDVFLKNGSRHANEREKSSPQPYPTKHRNASFRSNRGSKTFQIFEAYSWIGNFHCEDCKKNCLRSVQGASKIPNLSRRLLTFPTHFLQAWNMPVPKSLLLQLSLPRILMVVSKQ